MFFEDGWRTTAHIAIGFASVVATTVVANVAAVLTHPRPVHGHDGRRKVCARQLVGCAACARVDRFGIDMCKYDAHEEMVARLRALEAEHPGLARTGIIGKTVEGSDIFYIKVS